MALSINHERAAAHLLTLPEVLSLENARSLVTHWLEDPTTNTPSFAPELAAQFIDSLRMKLRVERGNVFNGAPYRIPRDKLRIEFDCPFPPPYKSAFTFIDLFAGIGGFRLALQSAGGRCAFSCEWDKAACCTYFRNFGVYPYGDINAFSGDLVSDDVLKRYIPSCDVLAAGFPCQPFSRAGVSARKSLGRSHGFACQIQGTLFFNIARIVRALRPKVLLLENVPSLCSHDEGRTFEVIRSTIEDDLNYSFEFAVIDASTLVPQKRKRCYMVCVREKRRKFRFPSFAGQPLPLSRILEDEVDDKYTLSEAMWSGHQRRTRRNLDRGVGFTAYTVDPAKPAKTFVARYYKDGKECLISQGPGRPPRMLTPREAARLQGFPENFRLHAADSAAYRQLGNSVPVPVVTRLAAEIVTQRLV